ncbi:hypothetical protein [Micromonospora sp. B9E7]|uniref:hypothetical protein n=1 Tax=Micromonospora sp. B9E7 TaxID=3153574 RepID=UPI00325D5487
MSIIELGEVRDEAASAPAVRRPRAAGRPLRSTAVLILALVVLPGAAPLSQQTVSVLPGIAGRCQASPPMLLCQRLDGTTAFWRWRR